jgi:hypothetical protein
VIKVERGAVGRDRCGGAERGAVAGGAESEPRRGGERGPLSPAAPATPPIQQA